MPTFSPPSYSHLFGPGLVVVFGTVPKDSPVSEETVTEWIDEEYIPRLLATHVIKSAGRFKAANPHFSRQIMIIYEVTDLSMLNDPKVKNVPRSGKRFPTDEPVETWVPFEMRVYSYVQIFTGSRPVERDGGSLLSACLKGHEMRLFRQTQLTRIQMLLQR